MRKIALFGTVMARALALAIVAPVFAAGPSAMGQEHSNEGHHKVPPIAVGTSVAVSGSGTAYKIGNKTITESASIHLTGNVDRSSTGRGMLNLTGGSLTVGGTTYTVVRGHGMVNYHSDRMTLHVVVKDGSGNLLHLILNGRHGKVATGETVTGFSVDFLMPQSKLAHLWFLKFQGATVTL